jgi:hypothetical protein
VPLPSAEQLAGPVGALVLALFIIAGLARVIQLLWRDHLAADQDDRTQRDHALELLAASLKANTDHAAASADMAKAWDARNRADAERRRRSDS